MLVSGDIAGIDGLSVSSHRQTYDGCDDGDVGAGNGPELIDAPILHARKSLYTIIICVLSPCCCSVDVQNRATTIGINIE
mmetsp:Transcript_4905/g.12467  ORF Transcript_4905/g.12467 Transcript_4905/m.12467 type:complete len:80 (-) Transcript_4905:33-272(-)